ncbi:MAG: class I SAM-dependent methyltransferase [Egibacteraceae bacterium]
MDLERSSVLYRHPEWYDQLRSDPGHATAKRCEELIGLHGPAGARTVLDFGCGTGQDLAYLAERFEVVGVDLQPRMIAYARQVRPHLDLRVGDMRGFRLGRPVDAVICLGNALAYLHSNAELRAAFATFAAHARPGTVLIVVTAVAATSVAAPVAAPRPFRVDTADLRAEVTVSYEWGLRTQIETMRRHWVFGDGRQAQDCVRRRVIFPRELELYLSLAGFELVELFDDDAARRGELTGPVATLAARCTGEHQRLPV